MWFVINVQIYCVLKAFALPLPLPVAYVVTAAAVLGLAVPTPGGLGSYQVAVQIALTDVFGVTRTAATRSPSLPGSPLSSSSPSSAWGFSSSPSGRCTCAMSPNRGRPGAGRR